MKFTLSWLKDHLETTAPLSAIIEKLTNLGLEVESIEDFSEKFKGFVVADVVAATAHPNADRLSLCFADIGDGNRLQVVCGAKNVRAGMKVAFAPIGVTIPASGVVLKKGKIRDVESFGMFCSGEELGIGEADEGILDLDASFVAGTPLVEALMLNDPIIDIAITPNRADCFGIRGIARDLAAAGLGTLKPLIYKEREGAFPCPLNVTIEDSHACSDFQMQVIRGVKNGPSPDWVQKRLRSVGQKPISALVDVTNYLTFDLGRPLHVFDLSKIHGNLNVRPAKDGETLTALNGKNYTLEAGITVIADPSQVLSIGGIMGGMDSSCLESTVDVLIECAHFDPIHTAKTGRALSLLSDARTRFERGMSLESIPEGLNAATQLILEWCGGTLSERRMPAYKKPPSKIEAMPITLTQEKLKSLSGLEISLAEAQSFLEALGFVMISHTSSQLTLLSPSHRHDIEGPADLVEEVLRLKGYDQIPLTPLPSVSLKTQSPSLPSIVKRTLAARGMHEVISWSFISEELAQKFGGCDDSLKILNPISVDLGFMRPSIIPNLLQIGIRNIHRGQDVISLFEVGPQFQPNQENLMATGLLTGTNARHWSQSSHSINVFDAKAHILSVLNTLGVSESSLQIETAGPEYYHPGRKGTFKQGNRTLATFGEIHPSIIKIMNGEGRFFGFEIFLNLLPPLRVKKTTLHLSNYQPVMRDFAFVVDENIPADQLIKTISKVDRTLITAVDIFDVYKGDKLEHGKKSLAVQVRLEPQESTLTDVQIAEVCHNIISNVEKATGGVLRTL